MNHTFRVEEAMQWGVESAILLNHIRFWLSQNRANHQNAHDGYYWTYNSAETFAKFLPYMSRASIGRHLKCLRAAGVLLSARYNAKGYDRTLWFTLPLEFAITQNAPCTAQYELLITQNEPFIAHFEPPIPDSKPVSKPGVNNKPSAHELLVAYGIDGALADDYLSLRKSRRAPVNQTVMNGIKREAEQAGLSVAEAVQICVERGWQSFKAEWVTPKQRGHYEQSVSNHNEWHNTDF